MSCQPENTPPQAACCQASCCSEPAAVPPPCPKGCATCTQHLTRPCCVLLEVTQRCNLGCPVCFAASEVSHSQDPTLETIATWYKKLYERAGACHIQLSGGEPTLRDDLDAIIQLGREQGFTYFQLNTNGIRLAEKPALALRLKKAGLTCVFLQFDGMSDAVHQQIRGTNLQAIKESAVDACAAAQLPVVLVPTLVCGVNEQHLMPLIRYGISKSPVVRGVHIQPMTRCGRTDIAAEHLTIARVIALLDSESEGMLKTDHFSGGNAEHPNCSFNAHYLVDDDENLIPSGVERPSCCGDAVALAQDVQARRWGADLTTLSPNRPLKGSMDEFLWQSKARSFSLTGMAFMDEHTLDVERLRRCYLFILNEEGIPIPFCAYNIAHRNKQPA